MRYLSGSILLVPIGVHRWNQLKSLPNLTFVRIRTNTVYIFRIIKIIKRSFVTEIKSDEMIPDYAGFAVFITH